MAATANGEALRVEHIAKRFGGVTALGDVNLRLGQGEVLGLIGDNGAGKSTLMKIICGFHQPDGGRIFVNGEEVVLKSVDHARSLGIDTVYQDLALVNELTVYHNMFLNRELVRWPLLSNRRMQRLARQHLEEMGVNVPSVDVEVAKLSGGQRQAIELNRFVHFGGKLVLLDEPFAALGVKQTRRGLDMIRQVASQGIGVVIITHIMQQAFQVADRIVVIRQGVVAGDVARNKTSPDAVINMITGETLAGAGPAG
jgi:D-xylose transport system ATP-binding protein